MALHLTDAVIRRLPTPERGNKVHYDGDVKGFGARVTAAGARSFVLNYVTRGGRERRITIGRFPDWSTTAARAKARALRRGIDDGNDPLADIQATREAPTVAELCDRFESEHLPRLRASSQADYKRMIANHIMPALKHLKVGEVAFGDIDALHRRITKSGHFHRANRVVAVLSKTFSLAVRWNMCAKNPCKGIERNIEYGRRRYLSGEELVRLTTALADHPDRQAANIVRVLLLTGCRRGEALSMRWADIDLAAGTWSKPPSSTKQREHHQAPLSAPARQLLSEIRTEYADKHPKKPLGEFVFPGIGNTGHVVEIKRCWRQLCKAAVITGLRIHDLRHSFASQLASGGASLPLIGALLGHSNPSTTGRYAHLFDDPQRAAVERVGAIIGAAGKAEATAAGDHQTALTMETPVRRLPDKFQKDIDLRLAGLQKAWMKARGSERDRHLLGALLLCGPFRPLPDWLYTALHELLTARLPQPPVDWVRWDLVLALRDVTGLPWDETLERASEMLKGTPAKGGPDAIYRSYKLINRSLPPEQRRPRTYERKSPLR